MRTRDISNAEVSAITELITSAENTGAGVYAEDEIFDAIRDAYNATTPIKAKDVGFEYMLKLLEDVYSILKAKSAL